MSDGDTEFAKLVAAWTTPAELGGSPPRPVRLTVSGVVLMVVAMGMLLGGAILGTKLSRDAASQSATATVLKEQGAEIDGIILRLWRTGNKDRSYRVAYQFELQGQIFHGEADAPRSEWERLRQDASVRVRYLPSDPSISRPVDWEPPRSPAWLPLVAPASFGCTTLIIFVMLRKQRRLLEDGRAAPGVINKVTRTKNGKTVRYDFLLPGGSKEKGSGLMKRGPAEIGALVTVIYDPDEPRRNAPYPFELVRPAQ